jgi:hypothetical protein
MYKYKLVNNKFTGKLSCILADNGFVAIPINNDNTDYQAYLKWLDEGGVVLPADE